MELTPELEAFIRYLALSPHKMADFVANPAGFLAEANVGPEATSAIRALGVEGVRELVQEKSDALLSDTSPMTYGRDQSVRGFGAKPPAE